jgi:hypothetical protein
MLGGQRWGGRHGLSLLAETAACAGTRVAAGPPAVPPLTGGGGREQMPTALGVRPRHCPPGGLVRARAEHAATTVVGRGQHRLRGVAAWAAAVHRDPVGREPLRTVRSSQRAPVFVAKFPNPYCEQ